jgi:hypothetical protein
LPEVPATNDGTSRLHSIHFEEFDDRARISPLSSRAVFAIKPTDFLSGQNGR